MGVSEFLAEATEEDGAQDSEPSARGEPRAADADPFLPDGYHLEWYDLEAEDADRMVGLLIAVTNLL